MDYIYNISLLNENSQIDMYSYTLESFDLTCLNEAKFNIESIRNAFKNIKKFLKGIFDKVIRVIKEKIDDLRNFVKKSKTNKVIDELQKSVKDDDTKNDGEIGKGEYDYYKNRPYNNKFNQKALEDNLYTIYLKNKNYENLMNETYRVNDINSKQLEKCDKIISFGGIAKISDELRDEFIKDTISKEDQFKNKISYDLNEYFNSCTWDFTEFNVNKAIELYKSTEKSLEKDNFYNKEFTRVMEDYASLNKIVTGLEKMMEDPDKLLDFKDWEISSTKNIIQIINSMMKGLLLEGKLWNAMLSVLKKDLQNKQDWLYRAYKNLVKEVI